MKVRKRDGREEDFSKIKIVAALIKSGSSVELADEIVSGCESAFKGRNIIESSEIREFVLNRLKERDLRAYENWLRFDSQTKGLSFTVNR
ncbi:MAG: ATP cone domain-containing protein [Candidatus Korarchaeum sp.]|nr:ATP cone domain-containing protein [Candidatus Korarchaeum sp.]MDW8035702.1 ATP cone domain-containing protein [Candidatus Korarchaeum sp.]